MTATDSLGVSSTITVTIKVTNVDEMPELEGEAPGGSTQRTARASWPGLRQWIRRGESIVWSLAEGDDMEVFSIEDGVLHIQEFPRL